MAVVDAKDEVATILKRWNTLEGVRASEVDEELVAVTALSALQEAGFMLVHPQQDVCHEPYYCCLHKKAKGDGVAFDDDDYDDDDDDGAF